MLAGILSLWGIVCVCVCVCMDVLWAGCVPCVYVCVSACVCVCI